MRNNFNVITNCILLSVAVVNTFSVSSFCRVTTPCSSTGRHTPSQFHCIPLNLQSYIPEAA